MVLCGFIFDIIVVRIDVPTAQFEDPNLLTVDVDFNNVSLKITPSRINVVEFRSGRSYEFDANSDDLRNDMEQRPLTLAVRYNGEEIGVGSMAWPPSVTEKISDSLGEITHVDECELIRESNKVGTLEIIIRLQCKCQEMGEDGFLRTGDDIRMHLDKVINPHDILFVVGEKDKEDICGGAINSRRTCGSANDRHSTALDLSRYRSLNGQLVQTPDVLNTCVSEQCCDVKNMANKYTELIKTLLNCGKTNGPEQRSCRATSHTQECPHDAKFSSDSTRDSSEIKFPCSCYAPQHDDSAFAGEKLINICPFDPPPQLTQTIHILPGGEPRRCPVCKENIHWMPKLAACPKCGYKPVPVVEECAYNEAITADQILHQYLDQRSSNTDQQNPNQQPCENKKECCCTCRLGKTCAHCRIRKLCEDIFHGNPPTGPGAENEECGKCEQQSSDMFNVCNSSAMDCRPYLERVFSELKDLYDIKEMKRKPFDINARCEKELQSDDNATKKKNILKKKLEQQQKQQQLPQQQLPQQQLPQQQLLHHQYHLKKKSMSKELMLQSEQFGPQKGLEVQGMAPGMMPGMMTGLVPQRKRKKGFKKKANERDRSIYLTQNFNKSKLCKPKIYDPNEERKYPGTHIGHKTCVNGFAVGRRNVPRNMGWLWNIDAQGGRRGWKPGAIRKPIKEMMKYFLKDFPADTLRVSQYSYRKQCKDDNKEEIELVQKPTLHICKKNDEYFITLRPLKDPEALKQCADPYLNMKPIQFKITKNPALAEIRRLKRCLKDMGFNKCTCHKPIIDCFCRSFLDKKKLEYQVSKECRKRNIPCCNESLVLSDTTDTDVEFDFGVTPPAGVIKPDRLKKPNLVNHGTQYLEGDWNIPPLFPKPPNKYMKLYNCAIGGRYGPDGYWDGRGGRGGRGGKDRMTAGGRFGSGKGGPGGIGGAGGAGGPGGKGSRGPVDMMQYMKNSMNGTGGKAAAAEKRKQKLRWLGEIPRPLLCMIDRRGKPDPCMCYPDPCCEDMCMRRNMRIC